MPGGGGPALFVVSDTAQAARLRQRAAELRAEHQDRHQGADRGARVSGPHLHRDRRGLGAGGRHRVRHDAHAARRRQPGGRADDRRVRQRAARAAEPGDRDPRAGERADLRPERACASRRSGADDRVVLKQVTIARDLGREVEIGSGLTAEDRIIESPPDGIASGDQVRIAGKPGHRAMPRRPRRSGSASCSSGSGASGGAEG